MTENSSIGRCVAGFYTCICRTGPAHRPETRVHIFPAFFAATVSSELRWCTGKGETASEKLAAPVLFQLMESNYKTAADNHAGKAEASSAVNCRVGNVITSFLRNPSKGARPARWEPSELQLAVRIKMEEFARSWWSNGIRKGCLYSVKHSVILCFTLTVYT